MIKMRITPRLLGRALRVALCYALALQAVLAAYGTALAASPSGAAADFVICHNADGPAPASPHTRIPTSAPCVLCAMAAAASGLLPELVAAVVAPSTASSPIQPADTRIVVSPSTVRAGLARAPPRFA
jgi:hypothetical protein